MLAPAALVALAVERGLSALAVTDHDSTEGVASALAAAAATSLTVVPGVELSTDVADGEVHVLGYFVDVRAPALQQQLAGLREGRVERGRAIVRRLAEAGVGLRWERVLEIAEGGSVGRPHVARALIEAGHAQTIDEAFDRYLVRGRPGYVERARFTPVQAVELIRAAGGVPVLAHPFHGLPDAVASASGFPSERARALVDVRVSQLVSAGLGGVEAYYPGYGESLVGWLEEIAVRHRILCTGGSDYHGPGRAELGSVEMPPTIQATLVDQLRAQAG